MHPKRKTITPDLRAKVWQKDNGSCYRCQKKINSGDRWQVEHEIPFALSFNDSLENLRVVHEGECHLSKTRDDVKRISKAKRQAGEKGQQARRKEKGSRLQSRGFDKAKTKRFDGTVVEREK